jgi:ClpP class serine protease
MVPFAHLAQRLFNAPLAIRADKAEVVLAALQHRFGIVRLQRADGSAIPLDFDFAEDAGPAGPSYGLEHGYDLVEGVAVIDVCGTLVQKLGTLRPFSGMTGYDGIRQNVVAALNDRQVEAIAFKINSPGGEVAGCFDLVDLIWAARERKRIMAILDENAFSAAYAIASAAHVITVPRTGGTGSVGVIYMHVDMSRALDQQGLTVTIITDGELKADGNDAEPLSDRAQKKLQADVSEVALLFRQTVARNRGLALSKVTATEAGTFLGAQGVEIGFADAVMAPDEAFAALLDELG